MKVKTFKSRSWDFTSNNGKSVGDYKYKKHAKKVVRKLVREEGKKEIRSYLVS